MICGKPTLPFSPVTTASIPKIPRHSWVLSSEPSSKASDNHRPESAGKSTPNAKSPKKCPGARSSSGYVAQIKLPIKKADPNRWDTQLRKMLRANHGQGWDIEPQSDRIKLTYRDPETAKRSAATLELNWNGSSSGDVMEIAKKLRQWMEEQDLTLANAYKQFRQNEIPSIGGCLNWIAVTNAFMNDRHVLRYRASTRSHVQFACDGLLEMMSADEP